MRLQDLEGSATARVCYISSESVFMLIYGSIIVRVALYKLLAVREINLSRPLLIVVLLIAGIVQGLFVSGGAFLVIYCSQTLKDKKSFRATFTMVWLTIYTGMFFLQLVQGVYS